MNEQTLRWYMVNKDGMATLCADKADAEKEANDAQEVWPHMGPHRAVQLVEAPLMGAAGDAGWVSVDERLPEPDWPVLAHNGKWTGVAAWMSGDYLEPLERWQDEHREFVEMMGPAITHWMPLPPPPSSAKGVAHG